VLYNTGNVCIKIKTCEKSLLAAVFTKHLKKAQTWNHRCGLYRNESGWLCN